MKDRRGLKPIVTISTDSHSTSQDFRASAGAYWPFLCDPGRTAQQDLWRDLREASREVRPDGGLSAPGFRDAWAAGDKSPFHGWDRKASLQVNNGRTVRKTP